MSEEVREQSAQDEEFESFLNEEYDPECFYKALSRALILLENFDAEAA